MRSTLDRLSLLTLLLLAVVLSPAVPAAAQTFSDTADVVVVEVPVQVLRNGEPVRGLTADDFEIFDGRKKQDLVGFDVVDLSVIGPAEAQRLPASARRHFLFLFDLSFSDPEDIVRARSAARDVVDRSLHPSDLAAVAVFTAARGPQLILSFTSDRRQIDAAISSLGVPDVFDRSPDPLGVVLAELESSSLLSTSPEFSGIGPGATGGGDQRPGPAASGDIDSLVLDYVRELAGATRSFNRDVELQRVRAMTATMTDLARLMGTVEGRKHLVYLSEGFDSSLLLGEQKTAQDVSNTVDFGGFDAAIRDRGGEAFGSSEGRNDLQEMLDEMRRADVVIHTVDIGGVRAGNDPRGAGVGKDGLVAMAKDTGGSFFENYNNLDSAIDGVLERTSVTYVLAFQPDKLKRDGKFHRLRVKYTGEGRGVDVVHRPGFYAPDKDAELPAIAQRLDVGELILSGREAGSLPVSVLAPPLRVPGERAYVPVLIEVDGASLLAGASGQTLPAEIYVYAADEQGAFRDFFFRPMGFDLTQARQALEQGGFKYYGHLDLPPGSYTLRVVVRSPQTGAYASRVVPVEVPEDDAPLLMPPLFTQSQVPWVIVREGQDQQAERSVPYPFIAGGQPFLPAALPRLDPKQSADVVLLGHGLGFSELEVDARVLSASGGAVKGGELALEKTTPLLTAQGQQLSGSFTPTDLGPGRYQLEVTVTDPASGRSVSSATPFEVVGKGKRGRG